MTKWRHLNTDPPPPNARIIGGWYFGKAYMHVALLVPHKLDHPDRIEWYDGKQRQFPTHWMEFIDPVTNSN